jgi:hypothetical protein
LALLLLGETRRSTFSSYIYICFFRVLWSPFRVICSFQKCKRLWCRGIFHGSTAFPVNANKVFRRLQSSKIFHGILPIISKVICVLSPNTLRYPGSLKLLFWVKATTSFCYICSLNQAIACTNACSLDQLWCRVANSLLTANPWDTPLNKLIWYGWPVFERMSSDLYRKSLVKIASVSISVSPYTTHSIKDTYRSH